MTSQTTGLTLNVFSFQVLLFWDAAQAHKQPSFFSQGSIRPPFLLLVRSCIASWRHSGEEGAEFPLDHFRTELT